MLTWLQLSGGTFPTGGFNHSYGVETYVKSEEILPVEDLDQLLKVFLSVMKYSDVIFLKESYQAIDKNEDEKLMRLDKYYTALKVEKELYNASIKTGRALLSGILPLYAGTEQEKLQQLKQLHINHYPIIYGAISSILNLPIEEAVFTYLYASLSNIVQVATRIVPLGQSQSQILLVKIREALVNEDPNYEIHSLSLEDVSVFNPGLQLASLKHETLFARLCMS